MAVVRSLTALSAAAGSISPVPGRRRRTRARRRRARAERRCDEGVGRTITSSPGRTPLARAAIVSAAVPEPLHAMPHAAVRRELVLEAGHLLARMYELAPRTRSKAAWRLRSDRLVLPREIDEGDRFSQRMEPLAPQRGPPRWGDGRPAWRVNPSILMAVQLSTDGEPSVIYPSSSRIFAERAVHATLHRRDLLPQQPGRPPGW